MIFSSITFLFYFLPLTLALYYLTPPRFRNITALLASLLFFAWGAPRFILLLVVSCALDYWGSLHLHPDRHPLPFRRRLLAALLVLNLGLLGYFKYANFFVEQLQTVMGWLRLDTFAWRNVILPIGISFFTFQKISYLVDVYRGEVRPARHALDHLLYIVLFPQLIAGPIVRYHDIALQLEHRRTTLDDFLDGIWRFCLGLAKKVLVANAFGRVADAIFGVPAGELVPVEAWTGLAAYAFQLYFDFAGYSDMAIGLGGMMGFRFLENFNFPYSSASITEFWRRWHISLGRFMMEYLYVPLGGNRRGTKKTLRNLWIVFIASGIWHGASWNFLFWGMWHGLLIATEKRIGAARLARVPRLLAVPLTFVLVLLGWVLFRCDNLRHAGKFYGALFGLLPAGDARFFRFAEIAADRSLWLVALIAIPCSFAPLFIRGIGHRAASTEAPPPQPAGVLVLRTALAAVLLVLVATELFAIGFNPFIYFRF